MSDEPPTRDSPAPLDYVKAARREWPPEAQAMLAMVITAGAILGAAVFGLSTIRGGVVAAPVLVTIAAAWKAWSLRRQPGRSAVAAGIWCGIIIALLVKGLCWLGAYAVFSRM